MITAVSMVKNSADVIETMIRGNSLVADNHVIINNASTDNTVAIIEELRKEGFKIDLFDDDSISPYQRDRINEIIAYALDKYHPDFILPLDDDEIICPNNNGIRAEDLKAHIESLDQDGLYYMNWRNYIPTDEDDKTQPCVALREKFCLDDEPEMTKKVLIPAAVARDPSFTIGWGSHYADSTSIVKRVLLKDVRLAHYPIRSSEQIASKAIVGWMNYLVMPDRDKDLSIHWKIMYKAIKQYGLPTADTMMSLATLYREHPNDADNLNVTLHPIDIPESVFELKYTKPAEINLLKNICENFERIAADYTELLRNKKSDS